ncbi:hypothetical protein BYT27DRAFT_6622207 [Phlegmacium glaucopus]|nr:hypothetical protein BYT27DRAFT_6622207 [Phlegmacium glaucopus]
MPWKMPLLNLSRFAVKSRCIIYHPKTITQVQWGLCVMAHGPIPDIPSWLIPTNLGQVTYILTHERPIKCYSVKKIVWEYQGLSAKEPNELFNKVDESRNTIDQAEVNQCPWRF